MIHRRYVSVSLFVTGLQLLGLFIASFAVTHGKSGRAHSPFVLQLAQTGSDKVTTILDSTKSVQMRSGFVTLQPGENVGSHNTGQHEELLVVLEGKGEVEAQGLGKKTIERGMVVYVPPNNQHNVYCMGTSPLKYVYVVSSTK